MAGKGPRAQQKKQWVRAIALAEHLAALADELTAALNTLVEVSAIEERIPDEGGTLVFITPHPWRWAVLADAELGKLTGARTCLRRWQRECVATLRAVAPEFESDFLDNMRALESIVDRSGRGDGPSADTCEAVLEHAFTALTRQRETLRLAGILLGATEGETLLVPDTNALYRNPYVAEWEGIEPATLVIIPQVNRELDKHKNESSNSVRSQKAELVIRQFDEFARRGDTIDGVTISGRLHYREDAVDVAPDPADELQIENDDDRILANVLHLRRRHPEAAVVLVTCDQNLKSKGRRHRVASDEPPPPRTQFKLRKRPRPD